MSPDDLKALVLEALMRNPDAGSNADKSAAGFTNLEAAEEHLKQHLYLLAASVRRTWAMQKRVETLRAKEGV